MGPHPSIGQVAKDVVHDEEQGRSNPGADFYVLPFFGGSVQEQSL